ncbi:MAG: aldehyde dehydrogenase family protein [Salibacteraceae bacterium]
MTKLNIQKTYKIFIGGKFPRTESGRYYAIEDKSKKLIANMCLSSRKDVKNAVVAARSAQSAWASMTAYNRGQILYRLAEMLEGRNESFVSEMKSLGLTQKQAQLEVQAAIDTLVYYAGWCDKYSAVFSSVNPTASAHFNFSVHEPTGVVAIVTPENAPLSGLVSVIAPVIAGGNTVIALASESKATSAINFAEVVQNSDVPGGVINILTGNMNELLPGMASHMDVNALVIAREGADDHALMAVTENVKRLIDWRGKEADSNPYKILDLQEVKTTWHPVQTSANKGGGY